MQDQAKLQFPYDVQSRVALLGLEGVDRQKETMTAEVRGACMQPQGIGAAQQHQKHANQIEHFAFRDREMALLSEYGMDLRHCPPFPEPPVANLANDL
jgi:hypothetical protein